jgi:hypothetical protein
VPINGDLDFKVAVISSVRSRREIEQSLRQLRILLTNDGGRVINIGFAQSIAHVTSWMISPPPL